MYLHYYLNEKYVGTVDFDVFLDMQNPKRLVACSPECEDLLGGMELVFGRTFTRYSRADMWDMKHGHYSPRGATKKLGMASHVFTTKKCGTILHWSNVDKALACKG